MKSNRVRSKFISPTVFFR